MKDNDHLIPILEAGIKRQLVSSLSSLSILGGPLSSVITWAAMKYIVVPILDETYEAIVWQINKHESRQRLRDVNESQSSDEFHDTFTNL